MSKDLFYLNDVHPENAAFHLCKSTRFWVSRIQRINIEYSLLLIDLVMIKLASVFAAR